MEGRNRLIFLDFDGVLHPVSATESVRLGMPLAVEAAHAGLFRWTSALEALLTPHPEVRIVVHSTWRLLNDDEELKRFLGPLAHRFAGSTPRAPRFESITWVVQQNRLIDYLILDDNPVEYPPNLPELLICDPELGVTDTSVLKHLHAWLNTGAK